MLDSHLLVVFTKVGHMFWQLNWPELWIVKRNKTNLRHGGPGLDGGGSSNPTNQHLLLLVQHTPTIQPHTFPRRTQFYTSLIFAFQDNPPQLWGLIGIKSNSWSLAFDRTNHSHTCLFSFCSFSNVPIPTTVPIPAGPIVPIRFIDCTVEKQETV